MHQWKKFGLIVLICIASGWAGAQDRRGPPPPPPPGSDPQENHRWPPPPPRDRSEDDASTESGRPPPPPPRPGQQQEQSDAPAAAAATDVPAAREPREASAPVASATPGISDGAASNPIQPTASNPIEPSDDGWAESSATSDPSNAGTNTVADTSIPQATPPRTVFVRIFQRNPDGSFPRWPWLLALALPIALLLLVKTVRKAAHLENEAGRLARHQRMLQNVNRNLQGESEHLRHLAINDPLTGTLNRRAFADETRALLDHLARFGRPLNLMVFDLDHFKSINDKQGHLAGDNALKLVTGIVRRHLDSDALFGRFGGDEFLIACADQTLEETGEIAEAIRRDVASEAAASDPPMPGLSLSIGIARANPESGYQIDALFHRADTALYAAKRGGRNRVVLANDDLPRPPPAEVIARQLA